MNPTSPSESVQIITFKTTHVAVLEHHGNPNAIGTSIQKFIAWRKQNHLSPKNSATFNIIYNNPADTPPDDYRIDLCVATDREIPENEFGIRRKTIPGGKCAVLRQMGSDDQLSDRITYLYATWLPLSGEELRDFPLYLQRYVQQDLQQVRFLPNVPDVPEHEEIIDIFLPLQ